SDESDKNADHRVSHSDRPTRWSAATPAVPAGDRRAAFILQWIVTSCPPNGHGQRPAGEHREPPVRCSVTLDGDRPTYVRRSRQSQSPKAPRTITARMLTQSGMLTPPAVTSTRKRTRSNCARAISQRRIAATSDRSEERRVGKECMYLQSKV